MEKACQVAPTPAAGGLLFFIPELRSGCSQWIAPRRGMPENWLLQSGEGFGSDDIFFA
jgi:hypothetical protein